MEGQTLSSTEKCLSWELSGASWKDAVQGVWQFCDISPGWPRHSAGRGWRGCLARTAEEEVAELCNSDALF